MSPTAIALLAIAALLIFGGLIMKIIKITVIGVVVLLAAAITFFAMKEPAKLIEEETQMMERGREQVQDARKAVDQLNKMTNETKKNAEELLGR